MPSVIISNMNKTLTKQFVKEQSNYVFIAKTSSNLLRSRCDFSTP